ncbi:hypothetical protein [Streptomyces sp. NPDC090798]|uniref:hypothetical protein n=1 Tax=Streptomyces sp. NPDC090798 TaxID=3365968 RepID=UPI00382209C6
MSTMRRPLGTGPSTTRSTTTEGAPRLLPVERVEVDRHLDNDDEDQAVVERKGRRVLGHGIPGTP